MLSSRIKFLTVALLAFSIERLIHIHTQDTCTHNPEHHRNHFSQQKAAPLPHPSVYPALRIEDGALR